jgi:hypothetical protein
VSAFHEVFALLTAIVAVAFAVVAAIVYDGPAPRWLVLLRVFGESVAFGVVAFVTFRALSLVFDWLGGVVS